MNYYRTLLRCVKLAAAGLPVFLFLSCAAHHTPEKRAGASTVTEQPRAEQAPPAAGAEQRSNDEPAFKEAELSKKEFQIEEKKAAIEIKEAKLAKEEVEILKQSTEDTEEVEKAVEKAKQEEMEALTARERVKIAHEKMIAAEQKVKLADEEVTAQRERAELAEKKLKEQKSVLHRKVAYTIFMLIVGYALLFLMVAGINRGIKDLRIRHLLRKTIVYLLNILIFTYIFLLWVQNVSSITIFFGVAGAGVALALQEVILSIAGWFLILFRRPFDLGDRIKLGDVSGDVIDIRILQTSLLEIGDWVDGEQSTGRIVHVPNSMVFKKENFNYSRGFEYIWNEIHILVTFESDWKRAEQIMLSHAQKYCEGLERVVRRKLTAMTKRYLIFYDHLSPIVYVNVKDSGVELTLRYLAEARSRRITQDALCRMILDDFEKEERVNFAYTTYRIVK